jgi:hypothetical protein
MRADFWLSLLSICISLGVPVAIFLGRNWFVAWISNSVQHRFNVKIEELRAELRRSEERFKSDLRDKEDEISALRNSLLGGSASRRALLDKRRFEAVERVWTAANDVGAQLKGLSGWMSVLNYKVLAKEVSNPKVQKFLSDIGTTAPELEQIKDVARDERPYLPELAWAYFSAYSMILKTVHARYMVLRTGVPELAEKFLSADALKKILKATLPHCSDWIDENEPERYHELLEQIELRLLMELRKILEGKEADEADAARAKAIMDSLRRAEEERTKIAVPDIKGAGD